MKKFADQFTAPRVKLSEYELRQPSILRLLTTESLVERARLNRLRGIAVSPELKAEIERRMA